MSGEYTEQSGGSPGLAQLGGPGLTAEQVGSYNVVRVTVTVVAVYATE